MQYAALLVPTAGVRWLPSLLGQITYHITGSLDIQRNYHQLGTFLDFLLRDKFHKSVQMTFEHFNPLYKHLTFMTERKPFLRFLCSECLDVDILLHINCFCRIIDMFMYL